MKHFLPEFLWRRFFFFLNATMPTAPTRQYVWCMLRFHQYLSSNWLLGTFSVTLENITCCPMLNKSSKAWKESRRTRAKNSENDWVWSRHVKLWIWFTMRYLFHISISGTLVHPLPIAWRNSLVLKFCSCKNNIVELIVYIIDNFLFTFTRFYFQSSRRFTPVV